MFDLGVLALRLVLGAVFLGHGAQKAFGAFGGPGFAGATGFVGSLGFRPARVWAALAVGGELVAGFLFLLGLLTPLAGLLVVATMVVAIAKVHGPKGFFVQNGGYEYNLVLSVAIVAGFLISALGGSRVQIGGPTGAFVVIVYAIVQRHGVEGLAMATLMAGVILVGFGLARLGGAIKFIPYPVTIGFTSGIALIILSGEVKDFLGLEGPVPAEFLPRWRTVAAHFGSLNPWAVVVSLLTLAIIVFWPRLNRRIPSPFVALIVTTAAVQLLHLPVDTIGSRFGVINAALPAPSLPAVTFHQMPGLMGAAFTIALLGAVESLLSAVVADGMIGGRHRSNMELVAQGIANIASPLFGGIPATGAIARTATNVRNGGRTPIAGITHAVTLLLITLFFGRWAGLIPMATLAGILVVVAYSMSEWRTFVAEFRAPKSDVAVLLTTFLLTVLWDLTGAIEGGMVRALDGAGRYDELGEQNVHGNIDDALNRAREHLGLPASPAPVFATPTVAREGKERA